MSAKCWKKHIILFMQNIAKMNDDKDEPLRTLLNEIDAKKHLLSISKKYKIPRSET